MTRQERYKFYTKQAQENPNEFYDKLVYEYKKYDENQKRIISELHTENRKLKIKVGQLESYVDEIVSDDFMVVPRTKIKELKAEIQRYRQENIQLEKLLICQMYPQYSDIKIPVSVLKEIAKLISEYSEKAL